MPDLQVTNNLSSAEQFIKDANGNISNLSIGTDHKIGIETAAPRAPLHVLQYN